MVYHLGLQIQGPVQHPIINYVMWQAKRHNYKKFLKALSSIMPRLSF